MAELWAKCSFRNFVIFEAEKLDSTTHPLTSQTSTMAALPSDLAGLAALRDLLKRLFAIELFQEIKQRNLHTTSHWQLRTEVLNGAENVLRHFEMFVKQLASSFYFRLIWLST